MDNAKNFLEFLGDYNLIQIPRIQRDYVQGGENTKAKDIRETFVGDLCNAIKEKKVLLLDFIYGNVEKIGENGCFYPLDGQQRLTTLFLLHWYGSLFLDDGDDVRKKLQKFSYQTRFSSEQFCKLLFNEGVINSAKKCSDGQKISEVIKDDPGYSKFWKYDPTVDSMLNMLDCIQKISQNQGITWENEFANTIKFYVYEIKDSQEPDDLYVKMNARGKHLTNFENFKAHLQQWMNDCNGLDDAFKEAWKDKMDADWSYFFWNAEERQKLEELSDPAKDFIDKPFWVFLNRTAILGYILNNLHVLEVLRKKTSDRNDEEKKTVKNFNAVIEQMSMKSADDYISPLLQKEIFLNNPEMYKTVAKILDLLSQEKIAAEDLYPLWEIAVGDNTEKHTLSDFFWKEDGSSRAGRLQILAFAFYCKHFAESEIIIEHLQHWMQFFHQICSYDNLDEQAEAGAISMMLIVLNAMGSESDIYDYLAKKYQNKFEAEKGIEPLAKWHFSIKGDNTLYRELFGKNQLDENNQASSVNFRWAAIWNEALKCYLRTQSSDWNTLLCNIEKNSILRGYIQGIISKNDNDDVLYNNVNTRFSNFSDEKQKLFSKNHESFVKLLGYIDLEDNQELYLPFFFLAYSNWRENVIKRQDITEPVCKVLLNPNDSVNVSVMPIWRKTLTDIPELITDDWGVNQAHTIKTYKDGKMHLYRKGKITSGTIVLDYSIHKKIDEILKRDNLTSESLEIRKIGDKIFYVCKSVDCIIGYGIKDDKSRIKFTTNGLIKEEREESSWKEGEFISWNDIKE